MNAPALPPRTLAKFRADCAPGDRDTFDSLYWGSAAFRSWASEKADAQAFQRRDAVDLAFAARQVEYVYTEAVKAEFQHLAFATETDPLIPWDRDVPEGAQTWVYYQTETAGTAVFFAVMAAGGLPSPSIMGAEVQGRVQPFGTKIKITVQQLRQAAYAGMNLEAELGIGDKRAHAELLNRTAAWGREDLGLPGFLNHPQVTRGGAATKTAGGTTWAVATAGELIADVLGLVNGIQTDTFEIYAPNVIAMPARYLRILAQTRLSEDGSGGDTTTVMEYLRKVFDAEPRTRGIRFRACEDLLADNSEGWLDTDSMIAFSDDPAHVRLVVPIWYRQEAVQQFDFDLFTPCESSIGGVQYRIPATAAVLTGLGS